jgi:hypothetical protein
MKKKTANSSNSQLKIRFTDISSIKRTEQVSDNSYSGRIVKLDPNQELYKRILNRKSY